MRKIHSNYLSKVAQNFYAKKSLKKSFEAVKRFNKLIRPQERNEDLADAVYRRTLMRNCLSALRLNSQQEIERRAKIDAFQHVLESNTKRRCLAAFNEFAMSKKI